MTDKTVTLHHGGVNALHAHVFEGIWFWHAQKRELNALGQGLLKPLTFQKVTVIEF